MLPAPQNLNCFEYLKQCTEIYDDVWMMEHFRVKYKRSEVFAHMQAMAAYFQKDLGLKKGDVFTIFMPTTLQSIISFYALNSIGVITSFVHPLMGADFLKEQLELVHSKGLMVLDVVELLSKGEHVKAINECGLPVIVCSSSDYSEGIKGFGCKVGEALMQKKFKFNGVRYKDVVSKYKAPDPVESTGEDIAVYLNGGGTTGKSKTIKLTASAINEMVYRISDLDEIHDPGNEAEVIVLPLFHCFGLCVAIHMVLCNSARIIPLMQFDANIFVKLMKEERIVGIVGIPLMFQKLMKHKDFDGPHLKNVRLMFCGGDDVSDGFLDEFNSYFEKWGAKGRLRQGYGLTEIASVCCTNTNTDWKRGSIGKAIRGNRVEIWDDNHKRVPNGTVGEFAITGPTIMEGYYMEGEAKDFGLYTDEEGTKWVLSGDLGYTDDEGYFYFSGRKKRLIIIAGYNVYPTDIEKLIGEMPFVKECCAVQGKENGRPMVRLYLTAKSGINEEECKETIRKACLDNFSKFYVPKDIIFMDSLPETPLMKVDFMKLTAADPEELRKTRKYKEKV